MKEIKSPIQKITSGNEPTQLTLQDGAIAVGKVSGKGKIFANVDDEILDLNPSLVTVNSETIVLTGDGSAENPLKAELRSGTKTENDPILIRTLQDLIRFRDEVNAGDNKFNKYYKLVNDIDLQGSAGNQWTPIGFVERSFAGTFDGDGHTITNLYIDQPARFLGLFGFSDASCTIKNLGIENAYVRGTQDIGVLLGGYYGSDDNYPLQVHNCWAKGTVISTTYNAGGLIGGVRYAIVSNCYADVAVSSTSTAPKTIGGLIGTCSSKFTILRCYVRGLVSAQTPNSGGLIAAVLFQVANECVMSQCYFDTQTTAQTSACGTETIQYLTGSWAGKTTAEMQQQATYAGWDFETVWEKGTNGYPTLRGFK